MPAGPQHKATRRATKDSAKPKSGRRRAAPPPRAALAGQHRATRETSGRRSRPLIVSAVVTLAAVAAPTAWATYLAGPAPSTPQVATGAAPPPIVPKPQAKALTGPEEETSSEAPTRRKAVLGMGSRPKPDPTDRKPAISRGAPGSRSGPDPETPDWLGRCDTAPTETDEPNGLISDANLCELPTNGHHLRGDAAQAWWRLTERYERQFGQSLCMTDAYRSLDAQQRLRAIKPGLAARPGTSNHGWGVAIDLCGGAQTFGTPEYTWLLANAKDNGWINPDWAQQGGSKPEPWHWEYVVDNDPERPVTR